MRMYAIINEDGKVLHTWHTPSRNNMLGWVFPGNSKYKIAIIEPTVIVEQPLSAKGIDYILERKDV